jgi:thiol-disulfide isomerase/thioredoxin
MPLMSSTMMPLGSTLPSFNLPDVVSGRAFASETLDGNKPVLVLFAAAHCPFTQQLAPAIKQLARSYRDRVSLVAICANDIAQVPADSPDGLRRLARDLEWTEPFCYDESQVVARTFGAVCTPECFLYDRSHRLVYRGQVDENPPSGFKAMLAKAPSGAPVRAALDAVLNGAPIDANQRPGSGCNIKWRAAAGAVAGRM